MTQWSLVEAHRTIEEVKRRSVIDPEFRALALSDAAMAISKVNPRPLPSETIVRFVENPDLADASGPMKMILLPDPIGRVDELSDAELDQVAGGDDPSIKLRT